ncbi:MAG: lamin tail domain-containing protein [Chitinophagaceae bacterium]
MKIFFLICYVVRATFIFAQAGRNDVIIDELMFDPSPPVVKPFGLPEVEFVELKNVSRAPYNLSGWKLSDASTTATISVNFVLLPDSFVVLCSSSAAPLLSGFGATIGLANFPSLDNDGEMIYIRTKEGKVLHALQYDKSWHRNAVKSEGGWTLEMIDTRFPCSGSTNWKSSVHSLGGTPGKPNSVNAPNPDELSPLITGAYATDSLNILLSFDEPIDSFQASQPGNYFISDNTGIPANALVVPPLFNSVTLQLKTPLIKNKVYKIILRNISDCNGNVNIPGMSAKVGLASAADTFDVVINEILFNPRPEGVDYVEIYNRGNKILDLKDLFVANQSASGTAGVPRQLSASKHLFFPEDYFVLTQTATTVKQQYVSKKPEAFLELNMPSLPDDKGTLILMNRLGKTIDALSYDEKWQFKLIDNNEGVALERVDYNKPTQDAMNWHSASTDAGYGTPTYLNSQYHAAKQVDGLVTISPAVFSPDNNGHEDFVTIHYQFPEPGYTCNITVYDVNGRAARFLCRNAICGIKGYFRWDGLDEKNTRLNIGPYVIVTEVFSLAGKVKKFKHAVILARKLH